MVPQGKYSCSRDSVWEFGAGKPEMDLFIFNFCDNILPSNSVLNEITQDKVGVFWNNLYGKDCTCFIEGFPFSF